MGNCRGPETSREAAPPGYGGLGRGLLVACLCCLCACAGLSGPSRKVVELPPLQFRGVEYGLEAVEELAPDRGLLALDDAMRDFVATYTADAPTQRQRLLNLHRAVTGRASLGIDYEAAAEGTAGEAFHRRSANCLAFANLFIALAREAGLDARYQWVDERPQWTRMGDRAAQLLHVNVSVHLNTRQRFAVDLEPLPPHSIVGSREISDRDARALYHSNLAMTALAEERSDQAWAHAVRALLLSPGMSHLWGNLGVVYRRSGQLQAAERAYLTALELDGSNRSAMNNLVVLYAQEGREQERLYWLGRLQSYREQNPFYQAWLGEQAAQAGDWREARDHYAKAVTRLPDDAPLLFALGEVNAQLGRRDRALYYIEQAVDRAYLVSEQAAYRARYEEVLNGATALP